MPVWWRYQDILQTVESADHVALANDLLRGLKAGLIRATADQVIYSGKGKLIREYSVTVAPETFRDAHTVFSAEKRANFRPEIGKFFNPRVAPPDGFATDAGEQWGIDCFGLAYRGEDIIREFGLREGAYVAAAAPTPTPDKSSANATQVDAAAQKRAISEPELERWFSQRIKAYDGLKPPRWEDCWDAARADYPDKIITRDRLQSVRRRVAHEWGPGRR